MASDTKLNPSHSPSAARIDALEGVRRAAAVCITCRRGKRNLITRSWASLSAWAPPWTRPTVWSGPSQLPAVPLP
jgi:hypothetical protein